MDKYLIENIEFDNVDFEHVNDDLPRYGEGFDYNGQKSVWCVYAHINKINGKMYIGISSNLKNRWANNGNRYNGCDAIRNAFDKYGWDNFHHIVLMNGLTQSMAGEIESYLIDKYRTYAQTEEGYNIAEGGYQTVSNDYKNVRIPVYQYDLDGIYVQSFDSISEANYLCSGKCSYHNGCISEALKKEPPFAYGYLWSNVYVDRMEPFRPIGNQYSDEYHKPTEIDKNGYILQIDKSGNILARYKNLYEISDEYGYRSEIRRCCDNKKPTGTYHGFYWMYENQYNEYGFEYVLKLASNRDNYSTKAVNVYDLDGNYISTYKTIKQAAIALDADSSSITKVCKLKLSYHKGYQFRYDGDPAPGKYVFKRNRTVFKSTEHIIAKIDTQTNTILKTYDKTHDIELDGYSSSNVLSAIKGKYKTSYGFIWRYLDENNNIIEPAQL